VERWISRVSQLHVHPNSRLQVSVSYCQPSSYRLSPAVNTPTATTICLLLRKCCILTKTTEPAQNATRIVKSIYLVVKRPCVATVLSLRYHVGTYDERRTMGSKCRRGELLRAITYVGT